MLLLSLNVKGYAVPRFYWYRFLFFSALLAISYLAVMPVDEVPVSTGWDKLNHLLAFAVLLFFLDGAYPTLSISPTKLVLLLVYGLSLEFIQAFIPNRDFSLLDVLADAFGLGFYVLLRPWILRIPIL